MEDRMRQAAEAAKNGDINALYQLIQKNVNVLEHFNELPFVQTPSHIAASAGKIPFATEMMGLMPSFAWKLNPDGFSPIHLALQYGHNKLVCRLLQFDENLVRVKGRRRITPLHYVVENSDNLDLLDKFLLVCPDSISDVTVQNETALHIALKNDKLEAFKFMVGWLGGNCSKNASFNGKAILNWEDDDGNTVLHVAVSKIKTQAVSHLLALGFGFVRVNQRNSEGRTAWDILERQTQVENGEIRVMLQNAGASSGSSLSTITRSDYNAIDEFYTLIGEDVKLLEHIDQLPFVQTPLHKAASTGDIPFAMEMMGLKPSFARKLNLDGLSPIHLALQNGHIELVRRLLNLDRDLFRVKGRERLTPLHYVVERHECDLLKEFLLICPDSITDVTVRNETALHVALKNDRHEAFEFLIGWLADSSSKNAEFNKRVLNWKDDEGNTVLHILVSRNQTQAVKHLFSWCKEFVDVNIKNLQNETAQDKLQTGSREIGDMLRRAGAKPGSSVPNPNDQSPSKMSCFDVLRPIMNLRRELRKYTEESRSMLLVVAALLVTLSYQAVLTPPGGLWPDNGQCQPYSYPFNNSGNYPKMIYLSHNNTVLECERKAGTAIASGDFFFISFLIINTALFSLSNSLTAFLIQNVFMKTLFRGLGIILLLNYIYLVWIITDDANLMIPLVSFASIYFVFIQLLS